jgi:hypothetical protein
MSSERKAVKIFQCPDAGLQAICIFVDFLDRNEVPDSVDLIKKAFCTGYISQVDDSLDVSPYLLNW